jgi:hypothetical protein
MPRLAAAGKFGPLHRGSKETAVVRSEELPMYIGIGTIVVIVIVVLIVLALRR